MIFDEVHCIGTEEGAVWERLLKTIPCPFLALSATISNKGSFGNWLQRNQALVGKHLKEQREKFPLKFRPVDRQSERKEFTCYIIPDKHAVHRFSDLRKHIFVNPAPRVEQLETVRLMLV